MLYSETFLHKHNIIHSLCNLARILKVEGSPGQKQRIKVSIRVQEVYWYKTGHNGGRLWIQRISIPSSSSNGGMEGMTPL